MRHRTQLYLDDDQHRWLRRRAGRTGSIAGVVRELIDDARQAAPYEDDPFIRYLADEPPADSGRESTVTTIDRDLYGE